MAKVFPKYGISFEVLYMARTEPGRHWKIDKDSFKYSYRIFKGIHPSFGNFHAHFNIGLLLRLLKKDFDTVVIGGLSSPTLWFTPFLVQTSVKIISIESNLHSVVRKRGFAAWLKSTLLKQATAYQVTGNPQMEYIKYFNSSWREKKFLLLPNLIDEDVFVKEVKSLKNSRDALRQSFDVDSKTQMWVLPARLITIKGIIPFLSLLEGIENVKLFLLGDGDLQEKIQKAIKLKELSVEIVGFVQQEDIVKYYAAADLFVLPSLKDPSPLSPIEGIASGLPILVSSRIGNVHDVLQSNVNGWCYDPELDKQKARDLVRTISMLDRSQLQLMGLKSYERYNSKFNTDKCINEYAKQIKRLYTNETAGN